MSVWQRLTAALFAIAAVVAGVFAFTGGDSPSAAAPQVASTPLWSVRRVPQAVVDAVGAQRLQGVLDADLGGDETCFLVAGGSTQLASHNPDTPLIGASTQKVLVAAATLAILGPDSHYQTKAVAPAAPADGTVERLFLVGGGDPVLSTNDYRDYLESQGKTKGTVTTSLESLADSIVAAGVRQIPGGVVGDDSRYDEQRWIPSWKSTYRTDGEVGPVGALTVNDGFRQWTPRKISVDDPALYAANELTRLLTDRGVQVGPASRGVAPPDAAPIASAESVPLSAVVASMLSSSDNLSAELFTKELGVQASKQGTTVAGIAAITAKLKALAVPLPDGALKDGLPDGVDLLGHLPDGHGGQDPVFLSRVRDGSGHAWAFSRQTVARVDEKFLGMDAMVCLIEDEPDRWFAYPGPKDGQIDVLRS